MKNVYEANVSATPPSPTGAVGFPKDSGGGAATVPGAYWFHMLTTELMNVLAAAGIAADSAQLNQVATAISTLIGQQGVKSWPTAGTANTYGLIFGNGTILQCAIADVNGGNVRVNFPHAFPNACKFVIGVSAAGYIAVDDTSYDVNGFTCSHDSGGHSHFTYVAWGY